LIYTYIFRLF